MKRKDFKIISDWIREDSTILDLGCGDSTLLEYLVLNKNSSGYGFEKNIEKAVSYTHLTLPTNREV